MSRNTAVVTVVLVACLVSSIIVGPAALAVDTASASSSSGPPEPPSGMVGIPAENIEDLRGPAAQDASNVSIGDLAGEVYTSKHADSMEVSIVTPEQATAVASGASPAEAAQEAVCSSPAAGNNPQYDCDPPQSYGLVLTDDDHTEGRTVAVRAAVIEESLGYVPSKLTIQNNETGETWTSTASVEDGWLTTDVQHFSSNAVTWSGRVEVDMTQASSGSTASYTVSEYDAIENYTATLEGVEHREYDNVTATGLTDGDVVSLDVAGNLDPTGPSANSEPTVDITNPISDTPDTAFIQSNHLYYRASNGTAYNLSVPAARVGGIGDIDDDGEREIAYKDGDDNNLKYIDTGGNVTNTGVGVYNDVGGIADWTGDGTPEILYNDGSDGVTLAYYNESGGAVDTGISADDSVGGIGDIDDDSDLDVAFVNGDTLTYADSDGNVQSISADTAWSVAGVADMDGDGDLDIAYIKQSNELKYVDATGNVDTTGITTALAPGLAGDIDDDSNPEVAYSHTSSGDLTYGDANGETNTTNIAASDVGGLTDINDGTDDTTVHIDLDEDGVNETSVEVADGVTPTREISSLSLSDDTAEISTTRTVDLSFHIQERTETDGASLTVNGNSTTSTGRLSDGETTSVSVDEAWIQEGENTVTVDFPSQSSDSPAYQVSVNYDHEASDTESVVYDATTWTESYNVSKTYGGSRTEASLTIPFEETVIDIKSLEYQLNDSGWTTASDSDYTLDQTTLTVDVDALAGGSIDANTTVAVRTDGRKVTASGGNITVLEPTDITADRLDTKIEIQDSPSNTPVKIKTGETKFGARIHYGYDASWDDTNDYSTITQDSQTLVLPNAETADTTRISTIPVTVEPATTSGDVNVWVSTPRTTKPIFRVEPGSSDGDTVTYTYLNAADGEKYLLYSETRDVIVDSGTASSPLSLTGSDDDGVLEFQLSDSDSDSDSTGGATGPISSGVSAAETVVNLDFGETWLVVLAIGGVLLLGVVYYRDGSDGIASATKGSAGAVQSAAGVIPAVLSWTASGLASASTWLAKHPYIAAALGGVAAVAAVATGVLSLPAGGGVFLLVVGTPAIAYVVLVQRLGASKLVWGAITAVSVILGIQLLGTDVFALVADSQAFLIVAAGGVYLVYQAISAYRAESTTPEEQNTIVFDTGDDDTGGGRR